MSERIQADRNNTHEKICGKCGGKNDEHNVYCPNLKTGTQENVVIEFANGNLTMDIETAKELAEKINEKLR